LSLAIKFRLPQAPLGPPQARQFTHHQPVACLQGLHEREQLRPWRGAPCGGAGLYKVINGQAMFARIVEDGQLLLGEILSPCGDPEIGDRLPLPADGLPVSPTARPALSSDGSAYRAGRQLALPSPLGRLVSPLHPADTDGGQRTAAPPPAQAALHLAGGILRLWENVENDREATAYLISKTFLCASGGWYILGLKRELDAVRRSGLCGMV
jgi:hypothetical protein